MLSEYRSGADGNSGKSELDAERARSSNPLADDLLNSLEKKQIVNSFIDRVNPGFQGAIHRPPDTVCQL